MLLNNEWANDKIKGGIKCYLKTNENENTRTQDLWDRAKATLGGKFIALQACLKKQEKSQNNLTFTLKGTGKQ